MPRTSRPIVRNNQLFLDAAQPGAFDAIEVGSTQWYAWLARNQGFLFEGGTGHFTARRETRRGSEYWYAYRRRDGKFSKTYLGKSEELTPERLEQASAHLAGQTALLSDSTDWTTTLKNAEVAEEAGTMMSIWARTKTRLPALPPKLIARPRLTRRITAPVTVIHAPSGYGKSTLLNEWRQSCGMQVAWAWLDASDNQAWHFWFTIVTALQTVNSDWGRDLLPRFHELSTATMPDVSLYLASEVIRATSASESRRPVGLILDDYHHITQPDIHLAVETFLQHLPPTLQLVMSSRTVPPLNLKQLRAAGKAAVLETGDLRLTLEEGIAFLEQSVSEPPLAYSEMQMLVRRTEGWIAGLKLAALALGQQGYRRQFTTTFTGTHTYLRAYFIDSVLHQEPESTRAFLFKTAILRQLSGDLCNAVTGQTDGTDLLAKLWQKGLFLVRLEEPGWYRYHDLFAEMLDQQLRLQFPAEIPRLHRRAAEWYRARNALADALHHLFAIQAYEEAADLIESIALRELEEYGEESRLLDWLRQLPETVVQQHKTLLHLYVRLAALALPDVQVERFLKQIERSIARKAAHQLTRNEQAVLEEIRQIRRLWADHDTAAQHIDPLEKHAEKWQILDENLRLRYDFGPDLPRAEMVAHEIYESARAQHNLYIALTAGGICASWAYLQGHFRRSESLAHQVLRHALAQRGSLPDMASIPLMVLSRICYARNQLAQAHRLLLHVAEVNPKPVSSNILIMSAIVRAKIQSAQGQGAAAVATLQAARELQARRPSRIWPNEDLIAYQALFYLRHGDAVGAEDLIREASGDTDSHPLPALVRAEILLKQGQAEAAADLLNRVLAQYPHGLPHEPLLSGRVMLALALFEQHKVSQARHVIAEAVRLAAPELFIRPFVDHGFQSTALLTLVLQSDTLASDSRSFVTEILRMVGQVEGAPDALSEGDLLALSTAASISTREQEVLRLLGAGLSNREIAARLSVSNSTVKTHLENIYFKLGVSSRTQAVAQAQALKLV